MNDWRIVLAAPRFRAFWLALLFNGLGSWCVIASLPILVAERFGSGMVLVFSLALRILPKLVLAPVAGRLMRYAGPARLAGSAMLIMAVLTAALPWCGNLAATEVVIAAIGALDLFIMPGLLALRGPVTPLGLEMAANTLCSVADRLAKVAGSALGGIAAMAGFVPAFGGFAVLVAGAGVAVWRMPVFEAPEPGMRGGLRDVLSMLREDRTVGGLLIVAATYCVMLGGLRPFLFWANHDWYGANDAAWTGLLMAQGVGSLLGALASILVLPRLIGSMPAYRLTLISGIIEGAIHVLLLAASSSLQAIVMLVLSGIPEIICTASWFTAMQERLSPVRQGVFFTFTTPIWDLCFAIGVASAGLYAEDVVPLAAYWALVSLTATLPLIPLLWTRQARRQSV